MLPHAFPTVTLKPIGRCVYCGTLNNLQNEHVIPFSLDGYIVLPKSTCANCAKITSYLEGYCARKIFMGARAVRGMQTRRPKDRPKQLPITLNFMDRTEERLLPLDKHPGLFALVAYQRPGMLAGRSSEEPFGKVIYRLFGKNLEEIKLNELLSKEGAIGASINWNFDAIIFARMLAKIAHVQAAYVVGLENFTPYLPNLILKKNTVMPFYVGTELERAPPTKYGHLIECFRHKIGSLSLLIASIQLFAQAETPQYWVVAGELSPDYQTPAERGFPPPYIS